MAGTESGDSLSAASALLKAGKTTEADQMITRLDAAAKAAAGAAEPPEPLQPRKPEEVILDLFKGIHGLLGNSPGLKPLISELESVLTPPAPTSTAS